MSNERLPNSQEFKIPTPEQVGWQSKHDEALAAAIMGMIGGGEKDAELSKLNDAVGLNHLEKSLSEAVGNHFKENPTHDDTNALPRVHISFGAPDSTLKALTSLGLGGEDQEDVRKRIKSERGDIYLLSQAIDMAIADSGVSKEEVSQKREEVIKAICSLLPIQESISLESDGSIIQQTRSGPVQWRGAQISEMPAVGQPASVRIIPGAI